MQSADTTYITVNLTYNKISHGLIELIERPGDHFFVPGEIINQFMYLGEVRYPGFSYLQ